MGKLSEKQKQKLILELIRVSLVFAFVWLSHLDCVRLVFYEILLLLHSMTNSSTVMELSSDCEYAMRRYDTKI